MAVLLASALGLAGCGGGSGTGFDPTGSPAPSDGGSTGGTTDGTTTGGTIDGTTTDGTTTDGTTDGTSDGTTTGGTTDGTTTGGTTDVTPPPPVVIGSLSVTWLAPTQRESGDPLAVSDLARYRIYYGPTTSPTANVVSVVDPLLTSYTITGLPAGSWQVAVSAVDRNGVESVLSNALQKTIQ